MQYQKVDVLSIEQNQWCGITCMNVLLSLLSQIEEVLNKRSTTQPRLLPTLLKTEIATIKCTNSQTANISTALKHDLPPLQAVQEDMQDLKFLGIPEIPPLLGLWPRQNPCTCRLYRMRALFYPISRVPTSKLQPTIVYRQNFQLCKKRKNHKSYLCSFQLQFYFLHLCPI